MTTSDILAVVLVYLLTNLLVQVEQLLTCVCVCVYVCDQKIKVALYKLHRHVKMAQWFIHLDTI